MKNAKYNKHLSFEDRCTIEDFLNYGYSFSKIANRLHKDRTTIARDVKKHRFLRTTNNCNNQPCCFEFKPPYVCNGCPKFNYCRKIRYSYSYDVAGLKTILRLKKQRYLCKHYGKALTLKDNVTE